MFPLTRRRFLNVSARVAGAAAFSALRADEPRPALPPLADGTSFFLVGDTHYLAAPDNPSELHPVSRAYTSGLLARLNALPGAELPAHLGGGTLPAPSGLIHAGDLIDSGDGTVAPFLAMQQTELAAWSADFGLNGADGRLAFPIREVHGNHDAPHGEGVMLDAIRERNARRAGLANLSPEGLHYSWQWGGIHFLNVGLLVGRSAAGARGFVPLGSLDFLIADLAANVGTSGRTVILTHHLDVGGNSPVSPTAAHNDWAPADMRAYHEALAPYRIGAILHGHTHTRRIFGWSGAAPTNDGSLSGIPVINTDNAAHYKLREQAFLHVQITDKEIIAREHFSPDGWATADWSPQFWRVPLPA